MSSILIRQSNVSYSTIKGAFDWQFGTQDIQISPSELAHELPDKLLGQSELFEEQYLSCLAPATVFEHLVLQWHSERGISSSTTETVLCSAYQKIIGMGPVAIPLILARLESEGEDPDQWFWALQNLTGADPTSEEDEGNFSAMAQSWLSWGRDRYMW